MSSASASSAEIAATGGSPGKSGKAPGMAVTLVAVVLGTWIGLACAGGVVYSLAKSGKIALGGGASATSASAKQTHSITLEPILANLADPGGHAYVRLGLRVEAAGVPDAAESAGAAKSTEASKDKGKDAVPAKSEDAGKDAASGAGNSMGKLESSIRDTVLEVLGRQTSAGLLGPDGKEHLKIELKEAIERGGVRVDVNDIFFTDFLVQI